MAPQVCMPSLHVESFFEVHNTDPLNLWGSTPQPCVLQPITAAKASELTQTDNIHVNSACDEDDIQDILLVQSEVLPGPTVTRCFRSVHFYDRASFLVTNQCGCGRSRVAETTNFVLANALV